MLDMFKNRICKVQRFGHDLELLNIVRNGIFEPKFVVGF